MESDSRHRSPARLLAPIALVAFGVVLLLVIASGGGGSGNSGGSADKAAEKRDLGTSSSERKQRRKQRTSTTSTTKQPTEDVYVVKQGDTLAGIAENTGVSVDRLQELNPGLDQFSLVAGQRIKLR
jgi:LysM repeat protein